jgi:ABC-type transport system involved in multi-copper enzyme maturation permease subunit
MEPRRKLWRDARWLAGVDVRRHWLSYPASFLLAVVIGAFAANLFNGIFVVEGAGPSGEAFEARSNAVLSSFFMFATIPYLMVNMLFNPELKPSFSRDDNFTRKLVFLRSLPVSAGAIVASRMLAMLATLVVAAPAFFTMFYLIARQAPGFAAGPGFVWFASLWIGLALLYAGGLLYIWIARSKRAEVVMGFVNPVALLLVAVALGFLLDHGFVGWTMDLAREYGARAGVAGLLVGAAGFAFGGWRTTRRLRRRDLSA